MTNDVPLIKNCPNCDAMIPIESQDCSFCHYIYPPLILTEEESRMSHGEVVSALNDAFFRLERYMDGKLASYEGFPFAQYMRILFLKTRENANYTYANCKLIGKYWWVIQQIVLDIESGNYETHAAEHTEGFNEDYGDLRVVMEDFLHEFLSFATEDEIAEETRKHSITDVVAHVKITKAKKSGTKAGDLASLPLKKFFKKIKDCSITQLEILNHVEFITEMNPAKLKLLLKDFGVYFYPRVEEEEAKYSNQDIEDEIKSLQERKRDVPLRSIPNFDKAQKDEHGKFILPIPTFEVIDVEKLLFSFKFYWCRQFINLLEGLIEKHKKTDNANLVLASNPLQQNLAKLGFDQFNFGKLSPDQVYSILVDKDVPFQIAFLNEAGFIKTLERELATTKAALHQILAKTLSCPGRTVKGNLNVLNPLSKEDRKRYTAHLHVPEVHKLLGSK